ncbi:putative leucine-rich repeat receptor-like serine/threonine-protein kinase At2g19230 isoform X3 [Zea mays]|nr:uncharacterized protein LOC100275543 isoform X3 [Zea mays]|eukprot:XP_008647631.2 uncharacterized protein LOC100275543 isoform X3 [Zea mays]
MHASSYISICLPLRSHPMAMRQSKLRAVSARPWLLLLCLALAATAGVMQARAQPNSIGFISIDCGFPGTTSYVDDATTLPYAPDAAFTDAGENHNVSSEHVTPELPRIYRDVRSFVDGARNCYTLPSTLAVGLNKYLFRAAFMYGNYDGLNRPPVFDLYIGVNLWKTVNLSSSDPAAPVIAEAIVVVPDDFVQVCLVNTGTGTPFISGLELRPLKNSIYPQVNATQGLVLQSRRNFGPTDMTDIISRYPDDQYDRLWTPMIIDAIDWLVLSTTEKVRNIYDDLFEVPSKVMQTAITPRDATSSINFYWNSKGSSLGYIPVFHFSEVLQAGAGVVRQFNININGKRFTSHDYYTPRHLESGYVYGTRPYTNQIRYNVSIVKTDTSTLPPIINADEIFIVISTTNVGTDSEDVSAMKAIKAKYQVKKNWMGDPCVAGTFRWDGLTCSYAISDPPKITALNMSFSGLTGDISSAFANLKAVQSLDLSHNNLTGSIPSSLSQLPSLTTLDLTGNQLSGPIPSSLLKRIQDGSLNLIYADNPDLCTNAGDSCQTAPQGKSKLVIYYVAVPMALIVVALAVLLCCLLRRRKTRGLADVSVKPRDKTPTSLASMAADEHRLSSLRLENRRFTYEDLEMITDSFKRVIGRGGFGYVYEGFLEDGTQVAVKMRSQSSNQGAKEFLTEAQILTRIHHKNLVSMVGYCKDGVYMALVYEYMSEGSLQEHIAGKRLTWGQRLRIALESAQGLEYLHRGCNPPLIHRDVKTSNILLNAKLEAKVADFGMSKALDRDTYASTNTLVGTPGYVDPEYLETMQPSTKSDVYSFGVVLLELVTGRPPILHSPQPTSVIQWARQHLARGDIEVVVDASMGGNHDVNSVWKAAEVALQCTEQASAQRPTMGDVVAQLLECLDLEKGRSANESFCDGDDSGSATASLSHSSAFVTGRIFGTVPMVETGPATR